MELKGFDDVQINDTIRITTVDLDALEVTITGVDSKNFIFYWGTGAISLDSVWSLELVDRPLHFPSPTKHKYVLDNAQNLYEARGKYYVRPGSTMKIEPRFFFDWTHVTLQEQENAQT